jgi:hypothetical protein
MNNANSIPESQKQSSIYVNGFALGRADAKSGHPFSRYVLQHGNVSRVDWRGHAEPVRDSSEAFFGRAYVEGCCK